jgi:hypothetical protein
MYHNANRGGDAVAAAAASGRPLQLPGWGGGPLVANDQTERANAERRARETDAGRQLQRCFPRWTRTLEHLRLAALERLAANQPVDPNDPDTWRSSDEHAQAVLRRHGVGRIHAGRLAMSAVRALIDSQARADRKAGLDWTTLTVPPSRLHEALRRAHAGLPIDLDDPRAWVSSEDQRRALGHRLGVGDDQADDLSRWALGHPGAFDADDLRCWRIASPTWLALADQQLEPIARVERPVAMFVVPAARRRLAARARALARRDPADRRARRDRGPRPAHGRRARRCDRSAAGASPPGRAASSPSRRSASRAPSGASRWPSPWMAAPARSCA